MTTSLHVLDMYCPTLTPDRQRFEVDLNAPPTGYGGYGSVYPLQSLTEYVVKRIPMGTPKPFGDCTLYTTHVTTTRRRFENILAEDPSPFVTTVIREILESLSLGWAVDVNNDFRMETLWLLLRRAPGVPLEDALRDKSPALSIRRDVARTLVSRMRTLRRSDLVHLDCVGENVFLDLTNPQTPRVTLIDLDGSGIIHRSRSNPHASTNLWEHRPFTIGHVRSVRVPPWYPQSGMRANPRSGNFLYAERWVVIDTVLRILSWGKIQALSWLNPSIRVLMADGYEEVHRQLDKMRAAGGVVDEENWRRVYQETLSSIASRVGNLLPYEAPSTMPKCIANFANLLQRAYFDPHELSGERLANGQQASPYATFDDWLTQPLY